MAFPACATSLAVRTPSPTRWRAFTLHYSLTPFFSYLSYFSQIDSISDLGLAAMCDRPLAG